MTKTIDERVNTKLKKMQEIPGRCLDSVNWWNIKNEINENHLNLAVETFYNLPWIKEAYTQGHPIADGLCEGYLFNHTMKFYQEGKDVLEIVKKFPERFKMDFAHGLLEKKKRYASNILDYLSQLKSSLQP